MVVLIAFSIGKVLTDASVYKDNWTHLGDLNPATGIECFCVAYYCESNCNAIFSFYLLGTAIFFGFAAALLGVSGFESSSNYIEEQVRSFVDVCFINSVSLSRE